MNKIKVGNVILGDEMPKICVSLMGKTKEEIKNQCREILDMNIDIVEWRCDFFEQILNKEEANQESIMTLATGEVYKRQGEHLQI